MQRSLSLLFYLFDCWGFQLVSVGLVFQTIELEKQAKMHLEETLRLSIEEKDDIIKAVKTQVLFWVFIEWKEKDCGNLVHVAVQLKRCCINLKLLSFLLSESITKARNPAAFRCECCQSRFWTWWVDIFLCRCFTVTV